MLTTVEHIAKLPVIKYLILRILALGADRYQASWMRSGGV
jgi:hypothetical protein